MSTSLALLPVSALWPGHVYLFQELSLLRFCVLVRTSAIW